MKAERKVRKGNPVSHGMAFAKAYVYEPLSFSVAEEYVTAEEEQQLQLFHGALNLAAKELDTLYETLSKEDESKAKIFAAHKEILEDEEILDEIRMAVGECLPFKTAFRFHDIR